MKRHFSKIVVISSYLAASLPLAETLPGFCQSGAQNRPLNNTQSTKNADVKAQPVHVNTTSTITTTGATSIPPQTGTGGIGANLNTGGPTTNLPNGDLNTPDLNGAAGAQEKLDLGKGALGNTNLNQLNNNLNQIQDLSQQAIKDGNPAGNSVGTAATFTEAVDGSTTFTESTVNSVSSETHNNGKSSSITFEEVQAQESKAAAENQGGAQLLGLESLIKLENERLEAQGNGSGESEGSQPQPAGDTSHQGTKGEDGTEGGNQPDNGDRFGIFSDPTKGSGGIGVQNSVDKSAGIPSEGLVGPANNDISGSLQNQVDRIGSGNLLRRTGLIDTTGGVEVRSLQGDGGASGRRSPFAPGGNFKQGFGGASGSVPGANLPGLGGARAPSSVALPGRVPSVGVGVPNLGAGTFANQGSGALPNLGSGRLPSGALPIGGAVPGAGRFPGVIPNSNIGKIPTNIPGAGPAARIPSFGNIGIPAINLPSRLPAVQTELPHFTPTFNAGAGRLPVSTPAAGGGAVRTPVSTPGKFGR